LGPVFDDPGSGVPEDAAGAVQAPGMEGRPETGEDRSSASGSGDFGPEGNGIPDNSDVQGGFDSESYKAYPRAAKPEEYSASGVAAFSVVLILLVIIGVIIVAVFIIATVALIVNPLVVGCRRFFFINLNVPARVGELGYGFDTEYKNIVGIMFRRMVYTFLWSCLFVVPGIVKNYEYMMVPYILAEEPGIEPRRAFAISREMMHGNKWRAFVLDLSFIPWNLLSSITCGIVGVFYVNPYKDMTHAAFYEQMRSEYTQRRMAGAQAAGAVGDNP
ncbi:MAG: DUF975 family protein, partial [Clostridiales bacterium]|nr:DUF975 family protein [Clostridiales bacterium]